MHFNNCFYKKFKIFNLLKNFLPVLFWLLLIFAFDTASLGIMTLCSAALHELSHFTALFLLNKNCNFNGSYFGLRISVNEFLSYKQEITVAMAGPLANIAAGLPFIFFGAENGYMTSFGILNLMTGLVNLIPVKSFDGYRILSSALNLTMPFEKANRISETLSFAVITVICFISLFLISKLDTGYFLFFVIFSFFLESIRA